ncbi:hypothetical protein chiPu_0001184 [Chiloscyllium punctatum]|uniref:Uncharacterized protein n=1 Tax=Chiloscyllium punctatum TaxID=137246 RepID=A0A401RXB1_CHIPU|nr:hypothetical protein [Chiloscyllium punctatum]
MTAPRQNELDDLQADGAGLGVVVDSEQGEGENEEQVKVVKPNIRKGGLTKELKRLEKDIEEYPFPKLNKQHQETNVYHLREVPIGLGIIGFINAPLTSGEVRTFKKEMTIVGLSEQVDQFLGLNLYTWMELMSILNILFTGEESEMIRRAAIRLWE